MFEKEKNRDGLKSSEITPTINSNMKNEFEEKLTHLQNKLDEMEANQKLDPTKVEKIASQISKSQIDQLRTELLSEIALKEEQAATKQAQERALKAEQELKTSLSKYNFEYDVENEPLHIDPTNENLYFYNKMPKCGSTMLHTVLKELSTKEKNNFNINHIDTEANDENFNDKFISALFVAESLKQVKEDQNPTPLVIVKHHSFINFTSFGLQPNSLSRPTSFNLIRNPILRWVSAFNFCRGGMKNNPGALPHCQNMDPEKLNLPLEEYIEYDPWIKERYSKFMNWLITDDCESNTKVSTGNCKRISNDLSDSKGSKNGQEDKKKVFNFIKNKVIKEYHVIGILEEVKLH